MRRAVTFLVALLATGCGGGYDIEYDCEQTLACNQELYGTPSSDTAQDACVAATEEIYEDLSDDQQERVEEVVDRCSESTSCDYIVCICDQLGAQTQQCVDARARSGGT